MAQFQHIITTAKGRALVAKKIIGEPDIQLKSIITSDGVYTPGQLANLDTLTPVRQTTLISRITRINDTAIKIEGALNNLTLAQGYDCNTVGITATDPDEGEILFGVTVVDMAVSGNTPDFIPAFNNVTSTGILFDLILTFDNADIVSLEVDPAAVATIRQLNDVIRDVDEIKVIISGGYNDEWKTNIQQAVGEAVTHAQRTDIHVSSEDRAGWNKAVQDALNALAMAQTNAGSITDLRGRMTQIEDSMFNGITDNPFRILFDDLAGIVVARGVWNKALGRVEC